MILNFEINIMMESNFIILAVIPCFVQVVVCGGEWCIFSDYGDTSSSYCSNGCCEDTGCCDDDSDNTGGSTIAGAVVGGVIALAFMTVFCICFCKNLPCGERKPTINVQPNNGTTISNVYTSQQSSSMQPPGYTHQGPPTNGYPQQDAYTNGYPQQGYPNQYPPQYPPPPPIYNDVAYPPQQGPPTK